MTVEKVDLKITDAVIFLYIRKLRLPSTDFFLILLVPRSVCAFVKWHFILIAAIFQEHGPFQNRFLSTNASSW